MLSATCRMQNQNHISCAAALVTSLIKLSWADALNDDSELRRCGYIRKPIQLSQELLCGSGHLFDCGPGLLCPRPCMLPTAWCSASWKATLTSHGVRPFCAELRPSVQHLCSAAHEDSTSFLAGVGAPDVRPVPEAPGRGAAHALVSAGG